MACNGAAFCKVCGGLGAVQSACGSNAKCAAFTFEPASNCGYLKGLPAGKLAGRKGWVSYVRE